MFDECVHQSEETLQPSNNNNNNYKCCNNNCCNMHVN